jgi:hypothetical protein
MSDYRQLLIGCGRRRDKRVWLTSEMLGGAPEGAGPTSNREWVNLYTLDSNPACKPDLVCDLSTFDWYISRYGRITSTERGLACMADDGMLRSNFWDEIHAYEVLEHLGGLGDERAFFAHFSELWRILKPGGHLLATCPSRFSSWLWGDPSHKRAILPETLIFLDQTEYMRQCDDETMRTPMSDFREIYVADFRVVYSHDNKITHTFILQAVKPSRIRLVDNSASVSPS